VAKCLLQAILTGVLYGENISTDGNNLEGETSIPDEIVNFRNIPIFVPNSLAGDYGKMRS
jgi:hypothetical protein